VRFSRNTLMMSRDTRAYDAAYMAAEEKIADLSNMVFETLPTAAQSDQVTFDNIAFTRTWSVALSGYVRCASVTVSWTSAKGPGQIIMSGAVN
jgi:hypothetical protein